MIKRYLSVVILLAFVAASYSAPINTITGMKKGTSWEVFSDKIDKDPTALATFVTGLNLATLAITPGSGVSNWLVTPSSANLATAVSDETGSGVLVFATSPSLVTPTLGVASSTSETVTGTAGAGFIDFAAQSGTPATPASSHIRIYDTSANKFAWVGASGYVREFDGTLTASRVFTLPDANTSFPVFGQTITFAGPTAARTVTFPDASFTAARTDAANTFTGTQTVGALVATTLNGNTLTTGTGVLTLGAGKTTTFDHTSTFTTTDGQTYTFPATSATLARTDAANTFTGVQTMTSPVLTTPAIGAATGTSFLASGLIKTTSASTGVGYATGAGGTATQITNRTTGVTMSPNPCTSGTVTTTTSSLAAEGSADFIVTDSAVAIGDVVVTSIQSGSNSGGTIVSVSTVTNGTFTIRVTNNNVAAGTAETGAIIINFAIIKAVSS